MVRYSYSKGKEENIMSNENIKKMIGDVLGGVTEDGSDYDRRVRLMDDKGVTDKVIQKLKDDDELQNVIDMIKIYQNDNITEDEREILYERTDEAVYGALRDLYPYVEAITDSPEGWGNSVFTTYLNQLPGKHALPYEKELIENSMVYDTLVEYPADEASIEELHEFSDIVNFDRSLTAHDTLCEWDKYHYYFTI